MTDDILSDMRKRDRLAKIKDRRTEYKAIRNSIVAKVRRAEREHIQKQVEESVGDMKKHWQILRKATNKLSNKEDMTTDFLYQGNWVNDKKTNADNYNSYVANVGPTTNNTVGAAKHPPDYYLQKHRQRNENSLLLSDVTADDVKSVCQKLTRKTSSDASGFKQNVVLDDTDIMAPVIAHLVNRSQQTGTCPMNSKIARVIPVYKNKGSKHQYENYRPISLLSVFSKIMERLIYNKIFEFLVRYEILFESQYGFRTGHSTTHASLDFVKFIEDAMDDNEYAIGVFCDLSKAFDTLNHDILLRKLDYYGIRGKTKEWFQSYLKGRQQYVDWEGCKSNRLPIGTGVPQGSILGPLLFLIYINDLPAATTLKCVLFADDSNLLIRGKDISILKESLNAELEGISDFFKANKLKLNAKKTKLVCFRKKSQTINYEQIDIILDGEKLKFEEEAVFLGLTIDSHLNWESHCKNVANKISCHCGVINRVKKLLPPKSLKILYSSLILPHLQYGLAVWGGCSNQNRKRIITIQKRVTRVISKSFYSSHTEPRMKKFGMLKFDDLYEQQCLTLIHDTINKKAPGTITKLLSLGSEVSNYNLRTHKTDPLNLRKPNSKSKVGTNSFCLKGPLMWNDLPQELKNIGRLGNFKLKLKFYFLNQYTNTSECNNPRCRDKRHHNCQVT